MQFQHTGDGYLVRLESGELAIEQLTEFLRSRDVKAARLSAIGAVSSVHLAYWNAESRDYDRRVIDEQLEVVSFQGNSSLKDGQPFLHVHGVFGKRDFTTFGGHIQEATAHPTLEVWIRTDPVEVLRDLDEESGLNLLDLPEGDNEEGRRKKEETPREGPTDHSRRAMDAGEPRHNSSEQSSIAHRPSSINLSGHQNKRKEQILTQPAPAKVQQSTQAVVLKQGSLFLLTNDAGDIPWELPHGYGFFYQDCRYLDGYTLTLNGCAPTVLSSLSARGFEAHHELANPQLPADDGAPPVEKSTIALHRNRLARHGAVHEVISLHNYGQEPAHLELAVQYRCRFEDLFVLKGFLPDMGGTLLSPHVLRGDTVCLRYQGTDGIRRVTTITFSPEPQHLGPERATFACTLGPGEQSEIAISITPQEGRDDGHHAIRPKHAPGMERVKAWLDHSERIWLGRSAEIRSSNPLFDRVLRRALLDLRMLRSQLDGLHYFAAGIPWFATLFGRDSATVCIQTMPYGPAIARDTLQLLARYQATEVDEYRDAEPGKILHEFRTGELAQSGEIPQSPAYYGTVDATLLFLILMSEYVNWSGDLDLPHMLRPNIEAALGWIDKYTDHDGDGYIDYVGKYANGLINQGWKDAGNSIPGANGSMPEPPIALCEVQAYLFRAWQQTGSLLRSLGEEERAEDLYRRASDLRERFERDFWSERMGCYALALEKGGRPVEVASSNTGQVLWGGIASPEKAARVVERLLAPDMFSGWGIRTLSSEERTYNPISYHLGSIWPHDNGLIIAGFCRYGHEATALRVFEALVAAASSFRDYRMPELYCGYERREGEQMPVRYPVACSPQAWAAGAIPHALWSMLGMRANAPEHRLQFVRPRLPAWLDYLEIGCVAVGDARVDLRFEREGEDGAVEVHAEVKQGDLEIDHTEESMPPDVYNASA